MFRILLGLFNLFKVVSLFGLLYVFLRWYIKGHFGKYAIFFWIYSIICFGMLIYEKNNEPKYDETPGYVYWNRNLNSY